MAQTLVTLPVLTAMLLPTLVLREELMRTLVLMHTVLVLMVTVLVVGMVTLLLMAEVARMMLLVARMVPPEILTLLRPGPHRTAAQLTPNTNAPRGRRSSSAAGPQGCTTAWAAHHRRPSAY